MPVGSLYDIRADGTGQRRPWRCCTRENVWRETLFRPWQTCQTPLETTKRTREYISTEVADYLVLVIRRRGVNTCFRQRCHDFSTHVSNFGPLVLSIMLLQYARALSRRRYRNICQQNWRSLVLYTDVEGKILGRWSSYFLIFWETSAVSTTDWMVKTQLCKLRGTSDTLVGRACSTYKSTYL